MSSHHFVIMVFCFCSLLFSIHVPYATSLSFNFNFSDPGSYCTPDADIACAGDAFFHAPFMELTMNDISEGNNHSIGRVWYAQPVPLWNKATGEVASFNTSFSFQIRPVNADYSADGMAFFLGHYPSGIPLGSYGGNLGLFNGSNNKNATGSDRIVAVEFDTFRNLQVDDDDNHVGIDVNSIVSVVSTSPDKKLTLGTTMTAEISYENSTEKLSVILWISETSYRINTSIDMKICLPEEVAIGFSAATGSSIEVHRVLSWSFNSTLAGKSSSTLLPGAVPPETVSSKSQGKVQATIAFSVAIFSVLVCSFMGFLLRKQRVWKKANQTSDGEFEDENDKAEFEKGVGPRRYHYSELAAATGNFAEEKKLGRGGFGHVYQGCLRIDDKDRHVAIKKLSSESSVQGRKEFEAEIKIISRLRHRNLVQLIGWCDSCKGLLIVYELVSEGSLDKHIYNIGRLLKWPERYNIIIGLGSALRYLHSEWEQSIVHGDIKPSNIMLDTSYNTKLGDFGLARLVDHGAKSETTKVVMGTAGYIDPELVNTRRPSTGSDVYSFGIVLLEVVSGRHPVAESEDKFFVLLRWVWDLHIKNTILEVVDKRLRGGDEMDERQMERVLVVGLWCAHPDRSERPSMAQAMHVLQSEDAKLPELRPQMYRAEPVLAMWEHGYTDLSVWTSSSGCTAVGSDAEPSN
ncbi:L-type lectin-domain containing receptor kinase IX.1 [Aegilops tauschii subsp. strangulata]|nr:L-type lectin-domain containing receptor kinase IX.1 [Aegilops tauschii subsp. strangulata]